MIFWNKETPVTCLFVLFTLWTLNSLWHACARRKKK